MQDAFICGYKRTPFGRYGGALAGVRADDLAAHVIKSVVAACPSLDPDVIGDVFMGCANQSGEDNRNVARMGLLLAGLPATVPGVTVNRLCGSGLEAVGQAARAIQLGVTDICLAGGVESMSRAPLVMSKAVSGYDRTQQMVDTTIGWRFINPKMDEDYGTDSMPETAENVAEAYAISREDQDIFALNSQKKAAAAQKNGRFDREIAPVSIPKRKGDAILVSKDEHIRGATTLDQLASLGTPFRKPGTVTAGNASGVNDGAACLLLASGAAVKAHNLNPIARVALMQSVGVEPKIMGIGPAPATQKLLGSLGWDLADLSALELNEAFAAQGLAVLRMLGLADDDDRVNPHGGAIALGHPLGASGARLAGSLALTLADRGGKGVATLCIGVGQGIAMGLEAA